MRDPTGRWSLVQLARQAGVSHRTARTIAATGILDPNHLTTSDVITLRVAAALLDAPRQPGQPRTVATYTDRDLNAITQARTAYRDHNTTARLLITPTTTALHNDPLDLVQALRNETQPVLLLPLGQWIQDLDEITRAAS